VFDDPVDHPTSEVTPALQQTVRRLEQAGVHLLDGWPARYNFKDAIYTDQFLLAAFTYSTESDEEQARDREGNRTGDNAWAAGVRASMADWQIQRFRQLAVRQLWQDYFRDVDVFLMPAAFSVAFPHDHHGNTSSRVVDTPEGRRPYLDLMPWIVTPTLTGCPATTVPIGLSLGGLPVGIQVMGPFWEDGTAIEFAALLADEIGGFVPPPGYGN
jgi:amidase